MTDPDLSAQATFLAQGVEQLAESVDRLAESQRRIKQLVAGIIAALVLVVALGVLVAFVAADARQASQRAEEANSLAEKNAQAQKVTCESGNEARRVSRQLWTYVLDLSSKSPDRTAEQLRQIRTFRAYLATVYADRDCSSPTPTPVPSGTATPSR